MSDWRGWLIFENDQVDSIEADGESDTAFNQPGLFLSLAVAGYPISRDPGMFLGRAYIDVGFEDGHLIAYGMNPASEQAVPIEVARPLFAALVDHGEI